MVYPIYLFDLFEVGWRLPADFPQMSAMSIEWRVLCKVAGVYLKTLYYNVICKHHNIVGAVKGRR